MTPSAAMRHCSRATGPMTSLGGDFGGETNPSEVVKQVKIIRYNYSIHEFHSILDTATGIIIYAQD